MNNGITSPSVRSVAISPNYANDSTVFAGTYGGSVVSYTVKTHFEENDPAISYAGTWNNYTCTSCSSGALKYSRKTNARATFPFNGTGIKWIVLKAKMLGKAKVYIDGRYKGMVDLYSPTARYRIALQKTGLTPGDHTITIVVSGQKNPSSTGYYVDIDAFEVVP